MRKVLGIALLFFALGSAGNALKFLLKALEISSSSYDMPHKHLLAQENFLAFGFTLILVGALAWGGIRQLRKH
ncbi:hypothetical protein GCM10023185_35830 [Hymenobacter saemangeumensis]|uniref:Uncharacterized protein n=1 Tax=Hymenobacter saemangeumensis TaxID=1084522 RepID=A0ABP8IPQ2_9BACT